jgi:ketosteroid isomerase-like protein
MSQENVKAARTIYEQSARGDFNWFAELGEDFELVTSRENPDAGVYRGETARRWLWAWVQSFEQLTIEATELIDAGEKVVVAILQRGCPHGSQTTMEGRWWQVITFRQGEIVRSELFADRAEALEAVGLRELDHG